jgi:hypothetical protein
MHPPPPPSTHWSVTVFTKSLFNRVTSDIDILGSILYYLLSTCKASVHHPFKTFSIPCFLKIMWDCGMHVGSKFIQIFLLKHTCWWHWFSNGDRLRYQNFCSWFSHVTADVTLEDVSADMHCDSLKPRQSTNNHDSLKADNLILERNLHRWNWFMSSHSYIIP